MHAFGSIWNMLFPQRAAQAAGDAKSAGFEDVVVKIPSVPSSLAREGIPRIFEAG